MAQFQQIVIDYLESYQPEQYEALKSEHRLRERIEELVDVLYDERDRELRTLKAENPDKGDEQLTLFAEQMAIATVLPLPDFEIDLPMIDEGGNYIDEQGNYLN